LSGAYAHITAVYSVTEGNFLEGLSLSEETIKTLMRYRRFCILGAVSPDYPYLDIGNHSAAEWADEIHKEGTDNFIRIAIRNLNAMPESKDKEKCIAWLFGFISHICTDMTIHPIVEGVAGLYSDGPENQKKHRICEMHQDSYIWQTMNLGMIGECEVVDCIRDECSDENVKGDLYEPVRLFWDSILKGAYADLYARNLPNINAWHKKFCLIVDKIEESHKWIGLARHLGVDSGLTYPTLEEVKDEFIKSLKTPVNTYMDYKDIFEMVKCNIARVWVPVSESIRNKTNNSIDVLGDWNLDRGLKDYNINDKNSGECVFWKQTEEEKASQSA